MHCELLQNVKDKLCNFIITVRWERININIKCSLLPIDLILRIENDEVKITF